MTTNANMVAALLRQPPPNLTHLAGDVVPMRGAFGGGMFPVPARGTYGQELMQQQKLPPYSPSVTPINRFPDESIADISNRYNNIINQDFANGRLPRNLVPAQGVKGGGGYDVRLPPLE